MMFCPRMMIQRLQDFMKFSSLRLGIEQAKADFTFEH